MNFLRKRGWRKVTVRLSALFYLKDAFAIIKNFLFVTSHKFVLLVKQLYLCNVLRLDLTLKSSLFSICVTLFLCTENNFEILKSNYQPSNLDDLRVLHANIACVLFFMGLPVWDNLCHFFYSWNCSNGRTFS